MKKVLVSLESSDAEKLAALVDYSGSNMSDVLRQLVRDAYETTVASTPGIEKVHRTKLYDIVVERGASYVTAVTGLTTAEITRVFSGELVSKDALLRVLAFLNSYND